MENKPGPDRKKKDMNFETVPVTDALRKIRNNDDGEPRTPATVEKTTVKDDPYTFNLIRWNDERGSVLVSC